MTRMDAAVLRDFFLGRASAEALHREVAYAFHPIATHVFELRMTDLPGDFQVEAAHLVRLCDAVLAGEFPPLALTEIAWAMVSSDRFQWDADEPEGARIADTLFDWSAPEIRYALTPAAVAKFRHRLLTGEDTFTRADPRGPTRIMTLTYRAVPDGAEPA